MAVFTENTLVHVRFDLQSSHFMNDENMYEIRISNYKLAAIGVEHHPKAGAAVRILKGKTFSYEFCNRHLLICRYLDEGAVH